MTPFISIIVFNRSYLEWTAADAARQDMKDWMQSLLINPQYW